MGTSMVDLREVFFEIIKAFLFVALGNLIGLFLLSVVYTIPEGSLKKHVNSVSDIFSKEGSYPDHFGSQGDNYSDAIYVGQVSIGMESTDENPFVLAVNGYRYGKEGLLNQSSDAVTDFLLQDTNVSMEKGEVSRFWNGWLVILKPLFLIFDYHVIRILFVLLQAVLLCVVLYLMKGDMTKYRLSYVMSVLSMNLFSMGYCLAFFGYSFLILLGSVIALRFQDVFTEKHWWKWFFLINGMVSFYFNMNYFQLCIFFFPMILYLLAYEKQGSFRSIFVKTLYFFSLWLFGYGGMMVGKWILFWTITKKSPLPDVFDRLGARVSTVDDDLSSITRIEAIRKNVEAFCNNDWVFPMILALTVFVIICAIFGKVIIKNGNIGIILTVLLFVVCHYFVFANHSYVHYWVMYRLLSILLFAISIFVADIVKLSQL